MFKKESKIFTMFALLLCAVMLFTACAAKDGGADQPAKTTEPSNTDTGSVPSDTPSETPLEKLKFTWYIHYDWATYMSDWGSDIISQWMDENKNVEIEWIMSGGAAQQKLSTMIVANDLPDVITLDRGSELESLINSKVLVPLDDYYEKYPYFQKWGGDKLKNALSSMVDGNWYGLPAWYTNEDNPLGNHGFAVDKKIYDAEGRPELKTIDQLYDYLALIKNKYPGITPMLIEDFAIYTTIFGENRVRDLIGLGTSYVNGTIVSALEDPEFIEAVSVISYT